MATLPLLSRIGSNVSSPRVAALAQLLAAAKGRVQAGRKWHHSASFSVTCEPLKAAHAFTLERMIGALAASHRGDENTDIRVVADCL